MSMLMFFISSSDLVGNCIAYDKFMAKISNFQNIWKICRVDIKEKVFIIN